jgi:hypothetical protein
MMTLFGLLLEVLLDQEFSNFWISDNLITMRLCVDHDSLNLVSYNFWILNLISGGEQNVWIIPNSGGELESILILFFFSLIVEIGAKSGAVWIVVKWADWQLAILLGPEAIELSHH